MSLHGQDLRHLENQLISTRLKPLRKRSEKSVNHYLLAICSTLFLSIVVSPSASVEKEEESLITDTDSQRYQGERSNKPKDVKPNVQIDWGDVEKKNYAVRAKTLSDFCLQISKLSHAGEFTSKWDLQYSFENKTGFVYKITIFSTRTIQMPKWISRNRREKKEQDTYESIINALWLHELKHNSDFEQETEKLKQNLENLTNASQAECEMVKELAAANYRILSDGYDTISLFSPINCPVTERRPAHRPPLD